ncbi:hypothetical protein [Xanthomonas sp. 1678]|uniref:hypothetical protein n=1 Tax=Xanthomonas sp. 1678 TaxID=3158788 RepID=UPI00285CCD7C|nr:hypothetical protein [Xanthomonas translucens]
MKRLLSMALASCALTVLLSGDAIAYKLYTHSTPEERRLAGITSSFYVNLERFVAQRSLYAFAEPVHEEITNRIYGCEADACAGGQALSAPAAVLAGVRWNDDPPFRVIGVQPRGSKCKARDTIRFETQPSCWVALFMDANKGAAAGKEYGPGDAMLYRTHFGDLQFLHAMALRDGEAALETKQRIMGWIEFTWRASQGEYVLDTRLKDIANPTLQQAFGRSEWRLLDLFTLGASGGLRASVDDVAFGSLLHTLQDSYAEGHAMREESSGARQCAGPGFNVAAPGAILEFHAYNHQDHASHAEADSRSAFVVRLHEPGDVVEIGRALVQARNRRLGWAEMQPFFECVLTLQHPDALSGPGDFAKR